jgi:septal ring factor EnvC (AmiA/AmiB activator)
LPKTVGFVFNERQYVASHNKVLVVLVAIALIGGGGFSYWRFAHDPLKLSASEIGPASTAFGAFRKANEARYEQIAELQKQIGELPIQKQERAKQDAQRELMKPIQKEIDEKTAAFNESLKPLNKQLEPMQAAIKESEKRIADDKDVKAKVDQITKLAGDLAGFQERRDWYAIQSRLREARWLPSTCAVDRDTWDAWYQFGQVNGQHGEPVDVFVTKDGRVAQTLGDRVPCTAAK